MAGSRSGHPRASSSAMRRTAPGCGRDGCRLAPDGRAGTLEGVPPHFPHSRRTPDSMTWSLYPSRWTALFLFFAVHWFFTLHRGAARAAAAEVPTAFAGAKIYPIAGEPIPAGVLIIEGGKISSVGPEAST